MKKKIISYILLAAIIILNINISVTAAEDGIAYFDFASGAGQYIKASARSAEDIEIDGVAGWNIPVDQTYFINCQVDNNFLYNFSGLSNISVKYYDGSEGKFSILYTNTSGELLHSETVFLSGSNKWKTHIFALEDCSYNDGILSNDFRITLEDKDGIGSSPVAFAEVSVFVPEILVSVDCDRPGHVFNSAEGAQFPIWIENTSKNEKSCNISIEVAGEAGNIEYSNIKSVNIPSQSEFNDIITAEGLENGFYSAAITVSGMGGENYNFNYDFTVVRNVSRGNADSIFGTCTHISGVDGDSEKMNSMMYMLKNSGVDYIRDEYYWDHVELEKGKYTFYADDYINACVENGIKPLVVLSYSNKFYGVPHNEEGYKAFAAYATALAEHLKGKVDAFEVWNEWNGGTWSGGYGIEEYANILKYTYEALKKVDPDITVVAGATITSASGWFESLFNIEKDGRSMFEYCDAISYHPYCFPASPDSKKDSGSVEDNFMEMYNMMRKFGTPKPQWITEYGWFTGDDSGSVSLKTQADYVARAYISGMAYGVEKIFAYDFKDDGTDISESEHNYGIIHSWDDSEELKYAPKPAYLATAAAADLLKSMEFVKEYRPRENIRMYRFQNISENKEVYAVYSADNQTVPFVLTQNNLKLNCYDIYGNEIHIKEIDGSPVYIEGEIGEFDLSGFITDFRTHASAVFGENYKYDGISVIGYREPTKANRRNVYNIDLQSPVICDIDDSWIYSGNAKIKLSVDYYDRGSGSFFVEYKSSDESVKRTEAVALGGTSAWKTADFEIDKINALNQIEGGDFKISASGSDISLLSVRAGETDSGTPMLSAEFDGSDFKNMSGTWTNYSVNFDGMTVTASDNKSGKISYVEKAGRYGVYLPAEDEGFYLSVNIDDDILYGGLNDITVYVDYFDEGNGNFDIAYDIGSYSSIQPSGNIVYLQDTKQWKTASFRINGGWLENYICDFRVALWTGKMQTSPEGITFGGIRIVDNKRTPSFNVSYDRDLRKVTVCGYYRQTNEYETPVTIQILQPGKNPADISDIGDVNETLRYLGEAHPKIKNGYKYFEHSFIMDSEPGFYLIRVRLPDENAVTEKYFYYYNLYDVSSITVKDSNGNILDSENIIGVDKLDVGAEFLSIYDDTDISFIAAVYDKDGVLKGVNFSGVYAVSGVSMDMSAEIQLKNAVVSGDKIKIFVFDNMSALTPISMTRIMKVK